MTQPDPTPQPKPSYREATADPVSVLVCQRCGALVSTPRLTCTTASM